jgi:hypothetical protein
LFQRVLVAPLNITALFVSACFGGSIERNGLVCFSVTRVRHSQHSSQLRRRVSVHSVGVHLPVSERPVVVLPRVLISPSSRKVQILWNELFD